MNREWDIGDIGGKMTHLSQNGMTFPLPPGTTDWESRFPL